MKTRKSDQLAQVDAFRELIATPDLPDIGPERRASALSVADLNQRLDHFFAENSAAVSIQAALRSAALLWHDHLDASHTISQGIHTADGSFLHGIMHRREPDYWNAKYWFRQVGGHPAYPRIAVEAAELLESRRSGAVEAKLVSGKVWDPFAFVDACEEAASASSSDPRRALLREIQAIEFRQLVESVFGVRS